MTVFLLKCQGRAVFKPAGLDQKGPSRLTLEAPKLAVLRCQSQAWAALGPSAFEHPASLMSHSAPGPSLRRHQMASKKCPGDLGNTVHGGEQLALHLPSQSYLRLSMDIFLGHI